MPNGRSQQVDPADEHIIAAFPPRVRRFLRWLERPSMRWLRIPLGIILIVAGAVGFLPVVGFWMIPFGALLVGQDVPVLRRPTLRFLAWVNRIMTRRKGGSDSVG
jgi:hypothetical protein